jgi:hypothetical protein
MMRRWWKGRSAGAKLVLISFVLVVLAAPAAYLKLGRAVAKPNPTQATTAVALTATSVTDATLSPDSIDTTDTTDPTDSTDTTTTEAPNLSITLPYKADWSSGINGWVGPPEWKILEGRLLDDGTGEGNNFKPIFAPLSLDATTNNYAVEAQIKVDKGDDGGSFGIVVRGITNNTDNGGDATLGGYAAGVGGGDGNSGINDLAGSWGAYYSDMRLATGKVYDPGTNWHTYRVEAKGNLITVLVDGAVLATVTDNKYLAGGQVGLWSNQYQLDIRSFTVATL